MRHIKNDLSFTQFSMATSCKGQPPVSQREDDSCPSREVDGLLAVHRRSPTTKAPAEPRSILLGGQVIPYIHRVSARARAVRLVIRPERGLEVVTPRATSRSRVEQVLREKARWITTTLERVARETQAVAPPPLVSGMWLPLAGKRVTLSVSTGAPAGRFRVRLIGETLYLTVADTHQETLRAALEAWYRRHARTVFAERLALWNARYGFTYGRVAIKEQKSRWGSCSRKGNLNFNWRLVLAPAPVLDYVVIHELCHLKELNHSPRFWQLVALACPDHAMHRAWLRRHGRELRF